MSFLLFTPGSNLPKSGWEIPHFDKFAHAIMFAILIFAYQFDSYRNSPAKTLIIIVIPIVLALAALSEFIQFTFVAGRSGNINDFIADSVGIGLGVILFRLIGPRMTRLPFIP